MEVTLSSCRDFELGKDYLIFIIVMLCNCNYIFYSRLCSVANFYVCDRHEILTHTIK